ncbi:MAG: tRNA (adenosine(37)-N6)-threonylcarbamoyltransferase complex transferase subunit TsaD [Candidatus Paceibacterota bacterium]|jgi:N6-L-threonylcarbamoyladenine synthase
MHILGIETSCDETAISLIEASEASNNVRILGNTVHTQIDVHAPYGGVFPDLAKREHAKNLIPVLAKTLEQAGVAIAESHPFTPDLEPVLASTFTYEPELLAAFNAYIPTIQKPSIDLISVTIGPGLTPALWVGINFARALSIVWNIPLVPSNHMEGHILAALIEKIDHKPGEILGTYDLLDRRVVYPALSLLISGGHTQIVLVEKIGSYKIIGQTRDDAVGECFDKIARTLGLPYPGGPKISALAAEARAQGIRSPEPLPRPMIASDDYDFSFSGLKTAVLYLTKRLIEKAGALTPDTIQGIAREAEDAMTDVLVAKMRKAAEAYGIETVIVGGGVIANSHIRKALENLAADCGLRMLVPQIDHSTDNALMIALAGYYGRDKALAPGSELKAFGTLPIGPRA